MACTYKLKGHIFNSELELDDFLLEKYKYISKLGDIVFSSTTRQNEIHSQLYEIHKKALEANHLYDLWREENLEIGEDGELTLNKYPYIGVNKFLANQRVSDERFFPEFIPERYWKEQIFPKWKNGMFTDEEKEILGVNNGTKLTNDACNEGRKKIERKWRAQAMSGTAVHGVLQLFFSKAGDTNVFDLENPKEWIINNLDPKWKPYLLNSDGTSRKVIDEAITYAQNLKDTLTQRFGENLIFFPEFLISANASDIQSNNKQTLIGIVDLLVLDSEGKVHIIDYKTSVKDYNKFDITKKTAYRYQMATYNRILESQGINVYRSRLFVAPIKLNNFRWDNDQWTFDGLDISHPIVELNQEISDKIWNNIDKFLPPRINITLTSEEIGQKLSEWMAECFKGQSSMLQHTEETTKKYLQKLEILKKNDNGELIFKPYGTKEEPIISKDEVEFIKLVTEYLKNRVPKRIRVTGDVKEALIEAIKAGTIEGINWPKLSKNKQGISLTWLQDTLKPYCNARWKVIDNDILESYGIIALFNKDTNQFDFIRISTNDLTENYRQYLKKDDPIKSRLGLTGQFEADVVEKSKSGSLMIEAINGNIEAMETMHIINLIDGLGNKNIIIGKISVVNPFDGVEICPSNEELLYCYNALNRHYSNSTNRFMSENEDERIQLASKFRIAANTVLDIMETAEINQYKDKYKILEGFKSCKSLLQDVANGDVDEKLDKLNEILRSLHNNNDTKAIISQFYTNKAQANSEIVLIHNTVINAIAKLKGINFRQQLSDHSKWLESAMIHKGISGTYIDNPGNLNSETLNLITKLVTEAYQNTRDEIQNKKVEISKRVETFKKAKGFDKLKENLGFNQVDLYKNLFEEVETGKGKDLMFKNLRSVSDPAEYEFLKFTLEEINKNRFPSATEEELIRMRDTYDTEYYRVPLARGGSDSVASTKGLMSMLRDTLKSWTPNNLWNRVREKTEGVMNSLDNSQDQKGAEGQNRLFEMVNLFDKDINTESRLRVISKNGIETFERNIETLLLKHDFAYAQQRNVDQVFPLIKAATIHIANQGSMQNREFKNDLDYIKDYIRSKIQNQSIVGKEWEPFTKWAGLIKQAASKMTLAFAPVQMFYQPLQGLWTDMRLMWQNRGTQEPFTFNNFKQSIKLVYSDLFNFSGNPTICSLLNELYGINDMDMNTYTDRISKAKKGLFYNFDNMMFKFSSRPDYYNRMSIFVSQMLGDGCLDAHSIKDGKLVYDWKLDKRFEAYANGRTSDLNYNKQKALYNAISQQFIAEHAKNPDGSDFKMGDDLPRAYTTKQSESMKSLGDDIYGYYSHEKKSLVMATALGSMWLQFKTYWSGKKNQYLQEGGVRLRGKWQQYSEKDKDGNEVKYYYQVDSKGNIEYDKPPTTRETIAPMMQWKGQWQEGILVTLGDCIAKSIQDPRHTIKHFKDKWNESDENLRNCYRSNIRQFEFDMFMLLVGGVILGGLLKDWLKDIKEESRENTDFMEGCILAAANVGIMSVKNSFLDFNFIETVGSPVGQWTPFAFEWTLKQWKNLTKVASGDEDLWDGALNTVGMGKQIRPIFDAIKPEMFRNSREGGTWESATSLKNKEQ